MNTRSTPPARANKRRVFLVEDHAVVRDGLAQLINCQADLQVCGEAATVRQALAGITATRPDAVLVDISLGDRSGLELIKDLQPLRPDLPLLVLSSHDETLFAERALRAGARGYVSKCAPSQVVLEALRQVLRGELYLGEAMRSRVVRQHFHGRAAAPGNGLPRLSDRELEVFQRLGTGWSTRQIAQALHLSVSTVETHRAHIKQKLHVSTAAQLMRTAVLSAARQAA
jgi:DNA-binding NarL/FixJ family response regulator